MNRRRGKLDKRSVSPEQRLVCGRRRVDDDDDWEKKKSTIIHWSDMSEAAGAAVEEITEEVTCPIMLDTVQDAMTMCAGGAVVGVFERSAILEVWETRPGFNPLTGLTDPAAVLVSCRTISHIAGIVRAVQVGKGEKKKKMLRCCFVQACISK